MVNETLQDIFDEFYARQARIEVDREKQELIDENIHLQDEIESVEDNVYDRNEQIENMNFEIRKAQYEYDECVKVLTEIKNKLQLLEECHLKELKWHLDHAKQDW